MGCIGKILGNRYEIIEEIGSGGMATVYKAKCKLLNRYVAIKVLRDEFANDAEFIKRFQVEAQSAASLSHPNIVSIYDVGYEDGMHYIVMELIEGKTLKEIIKEKGKLPWREAVGIASQIASGLSQAHQNHIVHRDIKPHNIIITKDGVAKVTDFGIAKAVSNSTINAFGSTIGSVHYFSPEHARGGYTDEKSDIYSLGVVLYEMCTGKLPFDGENAVAVALKHIQETPKEPIEICKDLPQAVNDIIMKAMKREPSERYSTAAEMYKDLQKVLSNPSIAVAKVEKTNEECPTQKISVADVEKAIKEPTLAQKIEKYKNEQDDEKMSGKKKKVTKSMALVRALIVLLLMVVVFWGCMKFGGFITSKIMDVGQKDNVIVPNLVGYKLENAIELLNERGLEVGQQINAVSEEYPKGYVVRQQYQENYTLKKGATVDLWISKGQKTVLVPDITKYTSTSAAEMQLKEVGLVYKEAYEFSPTIPSGEFIRQEPVVNADVAEGSEVTLYISKGPENSGLVEVPSVVGKQEANAIKELREKMLEIVTPPTYIQELSKEDGLVVDQDPKPGAFVSELTEVTLVINNLSGSTKPTPSGDKVTSTPTPSKTTEDDPLKNKKAIEIDVSNVGERDVFTVRVEIEGQLIGGRKVEYEAKHKRSDGKIKVMVSDIKGAMISVYIDGKLEYEYILK